jgi:hypothetical protein
MSDEVTPLLAVHQGMVYRAEEGPDGTLDLVAPGGTVPSSEFERLPDGRFVLRLSASLPEAVFTVWTEGVEHVDPLLGYVAEEGVVQRRVTQLPRAEWPRFPVVIQADDGDTAPNIDPYVTDLTVAVVASAPEGWQRIAIECTEVGERMGLVAQVTMADGAELHWSPPFLVGQWFHRLRMAAYRPGLGSWCTARYRLDRGAPAVIEFDDGQLESASPIDCYDELRRLPRHARAIPSWLSEQVIWGYQAVTEMARDDHWLIRQPEKPYSLLAPLFDGVADGERPYVYRPAIAAKERPSILDYLQNAPVVLSSRGLSPDLLHPERESKVPMAYHTDGKWVWSASVAYYLTEHGVPPAPDLVEHIRNNDYTLPRSVPRIAMGRASALAMDRPEPEATVRDDYDRAEFAVIDFAVRWGISKRYYSLGKITDQAWCLVREGDRYAVFWYWADEDRRELEHVFDVVSQAATFMIGQLYLNYPNLQRAEGELLEPWEVVDQPVPPDPPLGQNFEQLKNVKVSDFEADQFGPPSSIVLYPVGTPFEQIVPPDGEVSPTPRRLRLVGDWTLLSCVTKPSGDRPGGTQAYMLSSAASSYLHWGQIVEIPIETAGADGA